MTTPPHRWSAEGEHEFLQFWALCRLRVDRVAAEQAFRRARTHTALDVILEGYRRYLASKPRWQHEAHPATWLNHQRWRDEYGPPSARRTFDDHPCRHTPHCCSPYRCQQLDDLDAMKRAMKRA